MLVVDTPVSTVPASGFWLLLNGPGQLSVIVTSGSTLVIVAWQEASADFTYCAGQTAFGGVLSTTVTFAVHVAVAPNLSVTVSTTLFVVPFGYGPAGDCESVIGSPSGSLDPSSMLAGAVHVVSVGPVNTVTFLHFAIGGLCSSVELKNRLILPPVGGAKPV